MVKAKEKSDDRIVYGRVTYSESGRPAAGVYVTAMDADLLFDDKLGQAKTDEDGRFSITYGVAQFRDLFERAPDIYLLVHDERRRLLTTTKDSVIRNAGPKQEIHVQVSKDIEKVLFTRSAILKWGNRLPPGFSSLLARLVLLFEPISPRFISFLLRRKLKEWKNEGLIDGYEARTKRIGKFHHKIYIDLDLTPEQANRYLRDMLIHVSKRVRR